MSRRARARANARPWEQPGQERRADDVLALLDQAMQEQQRRQQQAQPEQRQQEPRQ